ncbi:MAG TPA: dTDP-4-dehydrorhamnose 3,5-epimerase [Caldilineaceae bacterium]|nr:dTDP-4-dehydrorhamnose 3,5-epimerase [Caldilineaceae bacterium]
MSNITESSIIPGVKLVTFRVYTDARGLFMETFRKEWFPERSWAIVQSNRSDSAPGVLRGLHYHHRQVDYWQVVAGSIRVGLADLRRSSPAFGAVQTFDLDSANPTGLLIPVGVAHGFVAKTPATLLYLVDNYYDGQDEYGVAWDDPRLDIDWGVQSPILSDRDRRNPRLDAIPVEQLPA